MKLSEKYKINPEFDSLFSFDSENEELEHEAKMIMYKFLSELEKINENEKIVKKDLAEAINVSPSYITQLFNGARLINLLTIAKIQKAYNISFEIIAKPSFENYNLIEFVYPTQSKIRYKGKFNINWLAKFDEKDVFNPISENIKNERYEEMKKREKLGDEPEVEVMYNAQKIA